MRLVVKNGLENSLIKPKTTALSVARFKVLELLLPIIRRQIAALQRSEKTIMDILDGDF